jgi:carbon-monoxide dehydrogenase small subunit
VEGLASEGEYHPIQQAFHEEHGLQCGFCTPGFLLATSELLENSPQPTEDEIRQNLSGNICRCTGYQQILAAVQRAAELIREEADS